MSFRKQLPAKPVPTVREMVSKYGDDWFLFCAAHPISDAVWRGDRKCGDYNDATLMRMFEKAERDRVDAWDMYEQHDLPPVEVEFVYPPIPERCYDWRATRKGYEPGDKMGYGRTQFDAIADLIEQECE